MTDLNLFQRAALRRNAVVRTWVLGGALVLFLLLHWLKRGAGFEGPVAPFAAAWAVGAAVNFLLAACASRRRAPGWLFIAEKVFDLLLTSALCALSGGSASSLTSLFFLAAFSAQVDLDRKTARWVQAGALASCLAAEILSNGVENADFGEWALWSVAFLLVTFCSSLVVAPFKRDAYRYERIQEIRREAETYLTSGKDIRTFPRLLLERLVGLYGFQHGALLAYEAPTRELILKAAVNLPTEGQAILYRQNVAPDSQGVGSLAAYERRTTFLRQPASNPKLAPLLRAIFEEAGSDRLTSVPMLHSGELVGVVLLSSAGGTVRVEDEEVAFLEFACGMVGGYLRKWESLTPPADR
jgi:hypothetical protein